MGKMVNAVKKILEQLEEKRLGKYKAKLANACLTSHQQIEEEIIRSWTSYEGATSFLINSMEYTPTVTGHTKRSLTCVVHSQAVAGKAYPASETISRQYGADPSAWVLHGMCNLGNVALPPSAYGVGHWPGVGTPLNVTLETSSTWREFEAMVKSKL